MDTLTLINKLAEIFLDIALPLVVLWLGTMIRGWLPAEARAHQDVAALAKAVHELAPRKD